MANKILLITSVFPPQSGGPAIFTSRFSTWLNSQNVEHQVVTYAESVSSKHDDVIEIGLNTQRLRSFFRFILAIQRSSNKECIILANGAFIETYLACKIKRRKYSLKIPGDHLWELSRNRGWTTKNLDEFQKEKMKFVQKILRILLNLSMRNAEHVITPSDQLKGLALSWGTEERKVSRIDNCVDPLKFVNLNLTNKNFDVIVVCRLVQWKGLEEVIESCMNLKLSLAIVGTGPLDSKLKNLALKSESKIQFFGNIVNQEVMTLLNSSKIYVQNSDYEATAYSLIEAKMCGLPILAKETDGSKIVVRQNIDGRVYSGHGSDTLELALKNLVQHEELITVWGKESRSDALLRFNQDITFPRILSLIAK
jgi:glycosyltransferase involved in cell wall biosynthesis